MEQQPSVPPDQAQNNDGANTQQGFPTAPQTQPADAVKVETASPEAARTLPQSAPTEAAKVEMPSPKDAVPVAQSPAETAKIGVTFSKPEPTAPQYQPAAAANVEVASLKAAPTVPHHHRQIRTKVEQAPSKDAPVVLQSPPADEAKIKVDSPKAAATVPQFPPADAVKVEMSSSKASTKLPQSPPSDAAKVEAAIPKGTPMVPHPPPEDAAKIEMTTPKTAPTAPQSQPLAAAKVEVASPKDSSRARLCRLVRRPDFEGYGFMLREDNESKQQFVTAVEPGSPAEAAGLRVKDIIIQVNGAKIEGASHQDIVDRLNLIPNEARLLVVDKADFDWYKKREGTDSLPSVTEMSCAAEAEANRSARKPASPQAGLPPVVSLSAEHDSLPKSVEQTSPDSSMAKLPVVTSGTQDPLVNVKPEPTSPTGSTLRRRFTPDEGYQPSSRDAGRQAISPRAPAPSAASVERHDESSEQVSVQLPPLDLLELIVRLLLLLRLPLPLVLGVVMSSLLLVYYLYARPSQD
ncbi:hypothetical protein MTO96_022753 [Rhipicephalus appendiculatus]